MPKRPKRDDATLAAAWLAECEASLSAEKQAPVPPTWPAPVASYGHKAAAALDSPPTDDILARAADAARAVRFSLAVGVKGPWCTFAEEQLSEACQALLADVELAAEARAFAAAELAASKHSRSPAALRKLERLAALDILRFALWGHARQRGQQIEHPVRLHEQVLRCVMQRPGVAAACRAALAAAPEASRSWGARQAWVRCGRCASDGRAEPEACEHCHGRPFGAGCALLRLLRARWVEGVAAVAPPRAGLALDCSEPRVREALLAWQARNLARSRLGSGELARARRSYDLA